MSAACCGRPSCARRSAIIARKDRRCDVSPKSRTAASATSSVAGGRRPEGRERRRIPPRLLLGPVRRARRRLRRSSPRSSTSATTTATRSRSRRPMRRTSSSGRSRSRRTSSSSCAPSPRRRRRSRCRRRPPCISIAAPISPTKPSIADAEAFFADLTQIFRDEIAGLVAAGCRYIQFDEVAVALLCDPAIRQKVEAAPDSRPTGWSISTSTRINEAVAGAPDDVVFGVHMCRGNFKGHYLAQGGYESVAERFFSTHEGQSLPAGIRHRRAPAISRRCASCRRARASCSG